MLRLAKVTFQARFLATLIVATVTAAGRLESGPLTRDPTRASAACVEAGDSWRDEVTAPAGETWQVESLRVPGEMVLSVDRDLLLESEGPIVIDGAIRAVGSSLPSARAPTVHLRSRREIIVNGLISGGRGSDASLVRRDGRGDPPGDGGPGGSGGKGVGGSTSFGGTGGAGAPPGEGGPPGGGGGGNPGVNGSAGDDGANCG